jgi:hypothetical protein
MMARQAQSLRAAGTVSFANGTQVTWGGTADIVQWATGPRDSRTDRVPAEKDVTPQWDLALARLGIVESETLHADMRLPAVPPGRSPPRGYDHIVLRTPAPPAGSAAVVLYQDEGGGLSWHFPDAASTKAPTFTIAARTADARAALASDRPRGAGQGPITKAGRKVLKVLHVPVSGEPLTNEEAVAMLASVERQLRHENVRAVDTANFHVSVPDRFTAWGELSGKRSLLILHGLMENTETMLASFPRSSMQVLQAHYGNRVISLDHLTLARSPEDTARSFLAMAKAAGPMEFDILCHGSGGIVARSLAEQGEALVPAHGCRFGKVLFFGAPNNGTPIADPERLPELLNLLTNLHANFPGGPQRYPLELLLSLVKLLAHGERPTLPGLAAIGTEGYVVNELNAAKAKTSAAYASVAADYVPDRNRDNAYLSGGTGARALVQLFGVNGVREQNDLFVNAISAHGPNGHPNFPLAMRHVLSPAQRVWHAEYFSHAESFSWMKRHYQIGAQAAVGGLSSSGGASGTGTGAREAKGVFRSAPAAAAAAPAPAFPGAVGAGGGAPPANPPDTLRRKPVVEFPREVKVGEQRDLTVTLEEVPEGAQAALVVALEAGADSVLLDVTVSAPGFEVREPESARMLLKKKRDADLEKVVFSLTALDVGASALEREIRVSFWLRNTPVGTVTFRAKVVPAGGDSAAAIPATPNAGTVVIPLGQRRNCEWVICADGDDENGKPPLRLRLRSDIPDQPYGNLKAGSLALDESVERYIETTLRSAFSNPPATGLREDWAEWTENFNDLLDALGRSLWDRLPQAFRQEYFRLYDLGVAPESILIHSDEMVLPWELMIPYDASHQDLPPLGVAHIMGRWRTNMPVRPKRQKHKVSSFWLLNPNYRAPHQLPWSRQEAETLRMRFQRLNAVDPATASSVRTNLLKNGSVHLLHFTGHGTYDVENPDLSALLLEDGELKAMVLTGSDLLRGEPFVYMNACNAGQGGVAAGKCGGLAAIMLQGGSSGVIAPYWPVEDRSAMEFSLALYDKLSLGRAIGEALQELRRENPRSPTFRAFTYFGDPWVSLDLQAVG